MLPVQRQGQIMKMLQLICLGGILDRQHMSFVGIVTLEEIERYHTDFGFVSCTGIDIRNRLTDANTMEGAIRRKMLQHSHHRICIADTTKLNKTTLCNIASLSELNALACGKQLDIN